MQLYRLHYRLRAPSTILSRLTLKKAGQVLSRCQTGGHPSKYWSQEQLFRLNLHQRTFAVLVAQSRLGISWLIKCWIEDLVCWANGLWSNWYEQFLMICRKTNEKDWKSNKIMIFGIPVYLFVSVRCVFLQHFKRVLIYPMVRRGCWGGSFYILRSLNGRSMLEKT